jgi:predicted N-acetyltransferase YhbS
MPLAVRNIRWPVANQDLERVDEVLMRAYLMTSRRARVERFLRVDHGMWLVAEEEGQIVGAGGAIGYPTGGFGWIGLIATDPMHGRQGVGAAVTRHLVDELRALGCASVLDGSLQGAPLYERLGFVDSGTTLRFAPSVLPTEATTSAATNVVSLSIADIDALELFDSTVFGASRKSLLSILLTDHAGRAFGVLDRDGSIAGYAIAQDDAIGPVAASSAGDVAALLDACLALEWTIEPGLVSPAESNWRALLMELGWRETRVLRHQRFGVGQLPGQRGLLVAQTSLGEG